MIRFVKMLVWVGVLVSFFSAKAQKALLQFDPKWVREAPSSKNWIPNLITEPTQNPKSIAMLPSAYCYSDLAFFCKLEVKIEKTTRFPIKFRLGDVGYVDWLEGKRNKP